MRTHTETVIARSDAATQSTSTLHRTGVDCFPLRKLAVAMLGGRSPGGIICARL